MATKRAAPRAPKRVVKEEVEAEVPLVRSTLGQERIQIEFLIEDLAKQLIIDRGDLVANGCNGCNSCS